MSSVHAPMGLTPEFVARARGSRAVVAAGKPAIATPLGFEVLRASTPERKERTACNINVGNELCAHRVEIHAGKELIVFRPDRIALAALLLFASHSPAAAANPPKASTDWNELTRWLPEPSAGQWAKISAALKTWPRARLAELEPILKRWDTEERYPWLRVLDAETTAKWLARKPLSPQERWLLRWSDRIRLSSAQLTKHRHALIRPRWWAESPAVVGPTGTAKGWALSLPEGRFEHLLAVVRAVDESGSPLLHLRFDNYQRVDAKQLAQSPHLRNLERLSLNCRARSTEGTDGLGSPTLHSFDGHCLNDRDLAALSASSTLTQLQRLELEGSHITRVGLEALAQSKTLRRITHLNLSRCHQLHGPILEVLARFQSLKVLNLSDIIGLNLHADEATELPVLEHLSIRGSTLRDGNFASFLKRTRTPNLTHLRAAENRKLGPATAHALATDPDLVGLQVLELYGATLGDRAARVLPATLSALRQLSLGATGAGKATAQAVIENPALELEVLDLSVPRQAVAATITASIAQALAGSPHLAGLTRLDLSFHPIGEAGHVAIARSTQLRSLEHLALNWTGATDASAIALAEAPRLAGLRYLVLGGRGLGSAGVRAFARARHLTRLYHLRLYTGAKVTAEDRRALRAAPHLKRTRL